MVETMAPATPTCPACKGPMVLRTAGRGQFFGCKSFPRCRGTRPTLFNQGVGTKSEKVYEPITILPGSDEQEAIWDYLLNGDGHAVMDCGPGCLVGDTFIDLPRNLDKYPEGIPIRNLVGTTPLVYGYDVTQRRIVLRRATRIWKTGTGRPVYKVTFRRSWPKARNPEKIDPPNYVIGTADHPFLLREQPENIPTGRGGNRQYTEPGEYINLTDLKPGMRIMALLREFNSDYTYLNLNNGGKEIESRFILSEIFGPKDREEFHAHHQDEDRHNNEVKNLEWKLKTDHHSDHLRKMNLEKRIGWQKTGVHPRGMLGKSQTEKQKRIARQSNGRSSLKAGYTNHVVEKVEFYGYEDIYNMTVEDCHNFVANGVVTHNTGKTWTSIQYCLRAPKSTKILFVAFNKHIATEAQGKLRASGCGNVRACTYHSLGRSILVENFPSLRTANPDDDKMRKIFEAQNPMPIYNKSEWRKKLNLAAKLATATKNHLLDYAAPSFSDDIMDLCGHYGWDSATINEALPLVAPALDECKRKASVSFDFDDMIWLPVILDLTVKERYDVMISDEAQDLNAVQHALMFKVLGKSMVGGRNCRAVVVGDKRQAVYGFRGALTSSIETLTERLLSSPIGAKEFPLTLTRRCPKLHVQLAQMLYPNIRALDDAPLGEILNSSFTDSIASMIPGDLVICRVNAPMISAAYALIRRGIRPVVKGHDFGKGLLSLVDKIEKASAVCPGMTELERFSNALRIYRRDQENDLLKLGDRGKGALEWLRDKCDCMIEFVQNSSSVVDIRTRIETMFSDKDETNAVVLGTIHRTKGLEAERVFILAPNLLPHPMASQEWELTQEKHCAWIAVTRCKFNNKTGAPGTLTFCGSIPPIFAGQGTPYDLGKIASEFMANPEKDIHEEVGEILSGIRKPYGKSR